MLLLNCVDDIQLNDVSKHAQRSIDEDRLTRPPSAIVVARTIRKKKGNCVSMHGVEHRIDMVDHLAEKTIEEDRDTHRSDDADRWRCREKKGVEENETRIVSDIQKSRLLSCEKESKMGNDENLVATRSILPE